MSDAFEELLVELQGRGLAEVDVARIKKATEASPLRKELADTKAALAEAQKQAADARNAIRATVFEKVGIKVKPEFLAIPEEVDSTSADAVKAWGITAGLLEAEAPAETPAGEQEAITVTAGAGAGAKPPATGEEAIKQAVQGAQSFSAMKASLEAQGYKL